mmetsp:Transcript_65430/g.104190  ORF Transcript_65430/g.104190 Transcript_65430/m.104190 type:complete len:111 (+) Transcript_65430:1054-1386(+)
MTARSHASSRMQPTPGSQKGKYFGHAHFELLSETMADFKNRELQVGYPGAWNESNRSQKEPPSHCLQTAVSATKHAFSVQATLAPSPSSLQLQSLHPSKYSKHCGTPHVD